MDRKPFGLLELGSNSLKFYLVTLGSQPGEDGPSGDAAESAKSERDGESGTAGKHTVEAHKFRWKISHQFFAKGFLDDEPIEDVVTQLRAVESVARGVPLDGMVAIATGVFREIDNLVEVTDRVKAATGVRIRVISGEDEAMLMARGFARQGFDEPVILCDLGGATTEWVWLKEGRRGQWGSLPLGAIRNEYKFRNFRDLPVDYLQRSSSYCDSVLKFLPFNRPVKVLATGGTAKALSRHYGQEVVTLDDLRRLTVEVSENGPPPEVKPSRAPVLLPGLVILWRVLVRCQARELQYVNNAVRHGMAVCLIRLLNEYPREEIHATLLLHTEAPADKQSPEV